MTHFADRLCAAVEQKGSCVVVGLDPRPEMLPPEFRPGPDDSAEVIAERIRLFHRHVIETVAPHAVAVKPQIAFFEVFGPAGLSAYLDAISFARARGLLVIGDIKRSDISSTAEAYAQAHLSPDGADAVTVNPYLGSDGLKPFIAKAAENGKGVFVLVKTSNTSAAELQDLLVDGEPVYVRVGKLVRRLGAERVGERGYSLAGAVVGATQKESARVLRETMPEAFFLVPGFGAQGGGAEDCAPCFNRDGLGAVVNSSRGILYAYQKDEQHAADRWREACECAVVKMKESLEDVRNKCRAARDRG